MRLTRSIALSAAAIAVSVGAASALPGGATYRGQTDKGGAVRLRLSPDAKRVRLMRIHYTVTCDDNQPRNPTYTDVLDARLGKNGKFRGSGSYQGSQNHDMNTFKVSGKVTAHKATGTFSLTSTTSESSCKSGRLTWSAKRQK